MGICDWAGNCGVIGCVGCGCSKLGCSENVMDGKWNESEASI